MTDLCSTLGIKMDCDNILSFIHRLGSPSFGCELFLALYRLNALFNSLSNFSRPYDFKQMYGNMGLELGIHRKI